MLKGATLLRHVETWLRAAKKAGGEGGRQWGGEGHGGAEQRVGGGAHRVHPQRRAGAHAGGVTRQMQPLHSFNSSLRFPFFFVVTNTIR